VTIPSISYSNTFAQWVAVTNSMITDVNALKEGTYTKTNGSITILSTASFSNTVAFTGNTNITGSSGRLTVDNASYFSNTINITANSSIVASGNISASRVTANGDGLYGLNASNVTSGSMSTARLSANTISGVNLGSNLGTLTFGTYFTGSSYNGSTGITLGLDATYSMSPNTIVARDTNGDFYGRIIAATVGFNGDGSLITSMNASSISTGTLSNSRLNANSSAQSNTIILRDASGSFGGNVITSTYVTGNGVGLSSLNASNVTSGSMSTARLSANTISGKTLGSNLASLSFGDYGTTYLYNPANSAINFYNGSNTVNIAVYASTSVADNSIVARDGSGSITANVVTANNFVGSSIQLQTKQTLTGLSNTAFTSIPSWAKKITLLFEDVKNTTNPGNIFVTIGSGGVANTTDYRGTAGYYTSVNANLYNLTTSFLILDGAAGSGSTHYGVMTLSKIYNHTWVCSGNFGDSDYQRIAQVYGTKSLGPLNPLDIIELSLTGGETFATGNVAISYE